MSRPSQGGQPLRKSSRPFFTNVHRRPSRAEGRGGRCLGFVKPWEGRCSSHLEDSMHHGGGAGAEVGRRLASTFLEGVR